MKFVFLMDPLETVIFEKDTTFALMLGAKQAGHDVFYLPKNGVTLVRGRVILHVTQVIPQKVKSKPFLIKQKMDLPAESIHAIFVRTDPPFDSEYLTHTWLLDQLPAHVVVINRPAGIRTVNEKIWGAQFTTIVPATMISRNRSAILAFIKREKNVIVKPTDGHGGKAVFRLYAGDANTNVILETVSKNFTVEIIIQQYVPAAVKGDKRIILLNGEPLGAVLRLHGKDDHRNNFFSGGKPHPVKITASDRKVIEILQPHLRDLGLYFVGIDLLGEYLTEVNVTSPTCLQEMNRLYGQSLEKDVISFVESLVREKRKKGY